MGLYENNGGDDYIGEPVTQLEHMVQCAEYLRSKGFSEKLALLVASHMQAQRYLTFKDPTYFEKLSQASKKTLEFQGGIMSEAGAIAFENDALSSLYISLRNWDERAKKNISLFHR